MHASHDPAQTQGLPSRMKLMLGIPVLILSLFLVLLIVAGMNDGMHMPTFW